MAIEFDSDTFVSTVLGDLNDLVNGDIADYVAFAEKQMRSLGKQAAWIASTAIVPFGHPGGFDDRGELDWFLDNLERMSANFARTIAGLTILTLEKAWNAIVGALWDAINAVTETALGFALPVPGPRP